MAFGAIADQARSSSPIRSTESAMPPRMSVDAAADQFLTRVEVGQVGVAFGRVAGAEADLRQVEP